MTIDTSPEALAKLRPIIDRRYKLWEEQVILALIDALEAARRYEEVSVVDLAKAIFSDAIADGPHTICAGIIAQFPGGLWRKPAP